MGVEEKGPLSVGADMDSCKAPLFMDGRGHLIQGIGDVPFGDGHVGRGAESGQGGLIEEDDGRRPVFSQHAGLPGGLHGEVFDHDISQLVIVEDGSVLMIFDGSAKGDGAGDLPLQCPWWRGEGGRQIGEGGKTFRSLRGEGKGGGLDVAMGFGDGEIGFVEGEHLLGKCLGGGIDPRLLLGLHEAGESREKLIDHPLFGVGGELDPQGNFRGVGEDKGGGLVMVGEGKASNEKGPSLGGKMCHDVLNPFSV